MHWLSHTKLSGAQMSQKTSWSSRKIDVENKVYRCWILGYQRKDPILEKPWQAIVFRGPYICKMGARKPPLMKTNGFYLFLNLTFLNSNLSEDGHGSLTFVISLWAKVSFCWSCLVLVTFTNCDVQLFCGDSGTVTQLADEWLLPLRKIRRL